MADHVLPLVSIPLIFINRHKCCNELLEPPKVAGAIATLSKNIAVAQSGSITCNDNTSCTELLHDLQSKNNGKLPYNFSLSPSEITFEALGWENSYPLFPQFPLVLAFIGEFSKTFPTTSLLEEAFTLVDASNIKARVTNDFIIVGEITQPGHMPTYLYASLLDSTQWNTMRSDDY